MTGAGITAGVVTGAGPLSVGPGTAATVPWFPAFVVELPVVAELTVPDEGVELPGEGAEELLATPSIPSSSNGITMTVEGAHQAKRSDG